METSVARVLARDIEAFAARLRSYHPLLQLAQDGKLRPTGVADYLLNARFLVTQTPRHLEAARRRSEEFGQWSLADLFARKAREEVGHERWADNDIATLRRLFGVQPTREPSIHLQDLAHYLDRIISQHPSRYLVYALFAEYVTVLLGPIWLAALSERCGVPGDAMTVVRNHVELDVNHVTEELREMDALFGAEDPIPYVDVLHCSMRFFELFCDELFETHRESEAAPVAAE